MGMRSMFLYSFLKLFTPSQLYAYLCLTGVLAQSDLPISKKTYYKALKRVREIFDLHQDLYSIGKIDVDALRLCCADSAFNLTFLLRTLILSYEDHSTLCLSLTELRQLTRYYNITPAEIAYTFNLAMEHNLLNYTFTENTYVIFY